MTSAVAAVADPSVACALALPAEDVASSVAAPARAREVGWAQRAANVLFGAPSARRACGGAETSFTPKVLRNEKWRRRRETGSVFAADRKGGAGEGGLPRIWVSEPAPDGKGRTFVASYPCGADRGGWRALELAEVYFSEALGLPGEEHRRRRVDCYRAAEMLLLHAAARGNIGAHCRLGVIYEGDLCEGAYWDGLADLGDACGSGASGARFREILRDSRLGAFGALSLLLIFSGQWLALAWHLAAGQWLMPVLAPAWGRACAVWLAASAPPHNPDSLGGLACAGAGPTVRRVYRLGALLLVCLLAFPSIPARLLPQPQAKAASGHSIWQILKKNKVFTLMLIACFFGMMGVMPISNFLVSLVNSHGGGSTALGVAQFLMAASELPSALVFGLLQKKMSSAKILLISIIFMVVKPLLILASGSLGMLLAVQPVQMLGYGLFFPASVYFANESVSPADRVQGQSIRTILAISLSTLLGSLVSGYLIDLGGTTLMLWFSTGCASIGVLIALGALAVQKKSVRV